ncbi:hypothetical protein SKAU_G00304060 [Synaphobranchus kaupii]|uniref:Uncharacterized protein n=1 Tax=Synaphobranchus kaupii TaxID=118154 RepID=A0A9Q1INJ9_SYNKA|nr:hypothetical protein SKAU_G00304060 [Synaphobranchus kaupii]
MPWPWNHVHLQRNPLRTLLYSPQKASLLPGFTEVPARLIGLVKWIAAPWIRCITVAQNPGESSVPWASLGHPLGVLCPLGVPWEWTHPTPMTSFNLLSASSNSHVKSISWT